MATDPPVTWVVEPTTLYFVAYYPTNSSGQAPQEMDTTMYNYPDELARAKALILANNSAGVCTITPTTTQIVYPPIAWEDF